MLLPEEHSEALKLAQTYKFDSSVRGKMAFYLLELLTPVDPSKGEPSELLRDWVELERLLGGIMDNRARSIGANYWQLVTDAILAVRQDIAAREQLLNQIDTVLDTIEEKLQTIDSTAESLRIVNRDYIELLESQLEAQRAKS